VPHPSQHFRTESRWSSIIKIDPLKLKSTNKRCTVLINKQFRRFEVTKHPPCSSIFHLAPELTRSLLEKSPGHRTPDLPRSAKSRAPPNPTQPNWWEAARNLRPTERTERRAPFWRAPARARTLHQLTRALSSRVPTPNRRLPRVGRRHITPICTNLPERHRFPARRQYINGRRPRSASSQQLNKREKTEQGIDQAITRSEQQLSIPKSRAQNQLF
jgi:hypothetical protein